MFVITNQCSGRGSLNFVQKLIADLICKVIGHDRDYPVRSEYSVLETQTTYASCICIRCWMGGYDSDKIISTGGIRIK